VPPQKGLAPGLGISEPRNDVFRFLHEALWECLEINDLDLFSAVRFVGDSTDQTDLTCYTGLAGTLKFIAEYGSAGKKYFTVIC
jgi:hypothetical protein